MFLTTIPNILKMFREDHPFTHLASAIPSPPKAGTRQLWSALMLFLSCSLELQSTKCPAITAHPAPCFPQPLPEDSSSSLPPPQTMLQVKGVDYPHEKRVNLKIKALIPEGVVMSWEASSQLLKQCSMLFALSTPAQPGQWRCVKGEG